MKTEENDMCGRLSQNLGWVGGWFVKQGARISCWGGDRKRELWWCRKGGEPRGVYGMRKERTSETQLIKYVPGSTEQKCVCGFSGVSLFFSKFSCRLQLSWCVGVTGRVGWLVAFVKAKQAWVQAKSARSAGKRVTRERFGWICIARGSNRLL